MGEWRNERFGQMAELVQDTVHPSDVIGIPYIGLEHIGEGTLQLLGAGLAEDATSIKSQFKAGDILFGKLRPYFRKVIRAPFDGICSTDIWVVRPKAGVDSGFLFYLMASDIFIEPLVRASEGTKMPRAKWDFAISLEFPLPPLPEQQAIARILGTLDDKIELNRRMNETLEAMARSIFKSWFVDFDPVQAKAKGREPAGMDAETAALFPDSFEETDPGIVPKGWRTGIIDDLCLLIENGGTPKRMEPKYWHGGTIPWFKTGELNDGPLIDSEEAITEHGLSNSSCKLWPKNTILIALYASPTVGRLGILEAPGTANQACSALLAKPEYGYLFLFYKLLFSREELQNVAVGAAQQNISQQVVRHHEILIPSQETAFAFQQIIEINYSMRVINEKQSRILAAIRDELLPRLLSGEKRIEVRSCQ
ncbi:type i restriction-modification system, specificity subunit s [hydrocarbon metagenome]|uniref:Type i restriction-modification system, specificity subunit s n=1 Tax=hydrocarbon metagenome TaxID=938273 RepID=A0A0W8F6X0_9ZZZZ